MKKNITINLFGTLYAIDEDAYALLTRYQDDLKKYFSRQEGGEEIAEDIERRVAELIQELKSTGVEAITIEHVKEIISRIGTPEEMGEGAAESSSTFDGHRGMDWLRERLRGKRLYRNPDDMMLGGVVSGLACYLGVDATWLRLLVVLLTFLSVGTSVLIYLILWLIVPLAVTTADRLQMQGKSVNMANLGEEILNGARRAGDFIASPRTQTAAHGCIGMIVNVFVVLLKAFVGLMLILLLVMCGLTLLGVLITLGVFVFMVVSHTGRSWDGWPFIEYMFGNGFCWTALVSFLVMVGLLIYGGVHVLQRWRGSAQSMTRMGTLSYLGALLVALLVFVSSTVQSSISIHEWKDVYVEKDKARRQEEDRQFQCSWLEKRGWRVVKHEDCENDYIRCGKYYTGRVDRDLYYIHGWSRSRSQGIMNYVVEKTVRVAPGVYRLTAAARTDGKGPEIYARTAVGRYAASVPVCGTEGGGIWQQAVEALAADSLKADDYLRGIAQVNGGKGYGWSRVTVENIVARDSVVHYGVSNRSAEGEWNGTWFSAADFKLERVR